MHKILYTGSIWQGEAIHPDLWQLLVQTDLLVEIPGSDQANGALRGEIVLGVPHQAEPGADQIAEHWTNPHTGRPGRPADESSALPALAIFDELRKRGLPCRLVIACHASDHDPNKTSTSPYWQRVLSNRLAGLLFELHGAASRRRYDLELSSGRNEHGQPLRYGRLLAYHAPDWLLAVQDRPGTNEASLFKDRQVSTGKLQNPALETQSLIHAGKLGIPALHLEMKFPFRQPGPNFPASPSPSPAAWKLSRAIAATLQALHPSGPVRISGADLGLNTQAALIRPMHQYEESFWEAAGEAPSKEVLQNADLNPISPYGSNTMIDDYAQVLYHGLPDDPPEECLWLVEDGKFIGRVIFFHWLNDYHRSVDGQVDYWIRPSMRRQGYGKLILRLLLERFRQLGVKHVLISCLASNTPSRKIIESSGGVFEGEVEEGGSDFRRRYWIEVPDSPATS